MRRTKQRLAEADPSAREMDDIATPLPAIVSDTKCTYALGLNDDSQAKCQVPVSADTLLDT